MAGRQASYRRHDHYSGLFIFMDYYTFKQFDFRGSLQIMERFTKMKIISRMACELDDVVMDTPLGVMTYKKDLVEPDFFNKWAIECGVTFLDKNSLK